MVTVTMWSHINTPHHTASDDGHKTAEQETVCLCVFQLRYSAFHRHFQLNSSHENRHSNCRFERRVTSHGPRRKKIFIYIYFFWYQFRYICKYQLDLDPHFVGLTPSRDSENPFFCFFNTCTDSSSACLAVQGSARTKIVAHVKDSMSP